MQQGGLVWFSRKFATFSDIAQLSPQFFIECPYGFAPGLFFLIAQADQHISRDSGGFPTLYQNIHMSPSDN
jgi:hypothetical protein